MMIKNSGNKREQIQFVSTESLVPKNHLLRDIDRSIDFSFIYELVEDKYSQDQGRPSIDPVMLIKIPLLQYLYGIGSMRQTIKELGGTLPEHLPAPDSSIQQIESAKKKQQKKFTLFY